MFHREQNKRPQAMNRISPQSHSLTSRAHNYLLRNRPTREADNHVEEVALDRLLKNSQLVRSLCRH